MTVGPVAWEWVALVVALAVVGAVAVCWQAAGAVRPARAWWRDRPRIWWIRDWWYDRRHTGYDEYDEEESCGLCAGCVGFEHCDGRELGCDCTCAWPEDWDAAEFDLPPERSQEELGFTMLAEGAEDSQRFLLQLQRSNELTAARERRAPWWEAEHRAAYESLGLDYPSGLMARVRELAP